MADRGPLLSVIIPVGADGLDVTQLEHIREIQASASLEFVIVLDGAPQPCVTPALESLESRPDTKIILSDQSGPGGARNQGIERASGEFLAFWDVDDWGLPNVYLELCRHIDINDASVGVLGFFETDSRGAPIGAQVGSPIEGWQTGWISIRGRAGIWRFVVRASLLRVQRITFPTYFYGEDLVFLVELLSHQPTVWGTPQLGYCYRRHGSGQLTGRSIPENDAQAVWERLRALAANAGRDPTAKRTIESWLGRIWVRSPRGVKRHFSSIPDIGVISRGLAWSILWRVTSRLSRSKVEYLSGAECDGRT